MPSLTVLLDAVGIALLAVLLYGIALVVRRRLLSRHGGTFELSFRARSTKAGRGWLLGLGRYAGEDLQWFRIFSLSVRPKRTWGRAELDYTGRRDPEGVEALSLYSDHVVAICETTTGTIELAMSPASLLGFQAWLQSMPPGTRGRRPWDNPGSH
ncbi:MAG: DUF2550 domain-containing protein [Nocardioidaceae bacterium]|nr:DUF2550 domain-containing protein [Nocardioidaceae bacterium]